MVLMRYGNVTNGIIMFIPFRIDSENMFSIMRL